MANTEPESLSAGPETPAVPVSDSIQIERVCRRGREPWTSPPEGATTGGAGSSASTEPEQEEMEGGEQDWGAQSAEESERRAGVSREGT